MGKTSVKKPSKPPVATESKPSFFEKVNAFLDLDALEMAADIATGKAFMKKLVAPITEPDEGTEEDNGNSGSSGSNSGGVVSGDETPGRFFTINNFIGAKQAKPKPGKSGVAPEKGPTEREPEPDKT